MDRKNQQNTLAYRAPMRESLLRRGFVALLVAPLICGLAGCGEQPKTAAESKERADDASYVAPARPAPNATEVDPRYRTTVDGVTYIW